MDGFDEPSDEALVRLIRDGDRAAYHELVDRYARKLRGRIERRLGPGIGRRVAASDILQEAHLVALQRYADFEDRGEGSFGRWFATIVERKVQEAIRRHAGTSKRGVGQEVTRRGRYPTSAFAGRGPTPSQVAVGAELKDAVREALAQLPEDAREVLVLLQEQGLTVEDAADRMARSPGAVRKLYGRALARLEALLHVEPDASSRRRRPTR